MENEQIKQNNLRDAILQKIQKGEVKMKPKYFFVLKVVVLFVILFVTVVTSVLLVSYTLFSLRAGGQVFLLGFGKRGLYEFFLVFPWLLLGLNVALLIFLDYLLKRFKFAYHNPIIYVFLGSLVVITSFGSLVNFTSFHKSLMYRAEGIGLPVGGRFYQGLRKSHEEYGIFRGEVLSLATSSFFVREDRISEGQKEVVFTVVLPPQAKISEIRVGDRVFVAGDVFDHEIRAYGIRKLAQGD